MTDYLGNPITSLAPVDTTSVEASTLLKGPHLTDDAANDYTHVSKKVRIDPSDSGSGFHDGVEVLDNTTKTTPVVTLQGQSNGRIDVGRRDGTTKLTTLNDGSVTLKDLNNVTRFYATADDGIQRGYLEMKARNSGTGELVKLESIAGDDNLTIRENDEHEFGSSAIPAKAFPQVTEE